jgi:crotonobetainyl-CoA:carnitine CoA-transferase CaiB-like acyl-CoA transferase
VIADLRTALGRESFLDLAADADVVVTGLLPETAERWGIGGDALCRAFPRLVHCAITGFGPTGPFARLKGHDALVAAKAGLWTRGIFAPRQGPLMFPVPWGSFGAGIHAASGILAALLVRDVTGRGQRVDATLVAGLDAINYYRTLTCQVEARRSSGAPQGQEVVPAEVTRFGVMVCTRDNRFIQTSAMLPHQGQALCRVAGIWEAVSKHKPFANLPTFETPEDAQAWEDLLWHAFRQEDLVHWLPLLEADLDVAFEVVRTSEQGLEHPQIVHNGDVISVEDPSVGLVREVGPVAHFSRTPCVISRSAPPLGENAGPFATAQRTSPTGSAPAHPLTGTVIVEFGYFFAMPDGVTMAASMGARVIKIEDGRGDPVRWSFGDEIGAGKTTAGKESLSVDLRSLEGRMIAHRLIEHADVFVSGFRPGVADRLGLGYEELSAINPRLVYMHAAGYGPDGPYARRALYAKAAGAVAGSLARQSGPWIDPAFVGGMSTAELQAVVAPWLGQVADGDSNAALGVFAALTLAIFHQRRTGQGQRVDTSMILGNAWAYSDDFCRYDGKAPVPTCDAEGYGISALCRLYRASEGWVCLVVATDREWHSLLDVLDFDHLRSDPRFASAASRAANDAALVATLSTRFAQKPAPAWEAELGRVGVGCVEVASLVQGEVTATDPVYRETGLTVEVGHPKYGSVVQLAPPLRFSETPGRVGVACLRGQHNRSILRELEFSEADIDRFEAIGAVIPPD